MISVTRARHEHPKSIAALLGTHRRALIVLGALISLATYFLKDVVKERTKERAAANNAGVSADLASMPELRGQLNDLFISGQMLNADPASIPRANFLALIGNLTLRAQTNTLPLSALLKACPAHCPRQDR